MDNLLFLITEDGQGACLEADTGEVHWRQRFKGRYFASVIAAGNRIYLISEGGVTSVVAADRTFKLLATNPLGEKTYATRSPLGNRLLFRTVKALDCLQER